METLFEFLALLQIAAGLFLLWQGIQWLAYVRRRLRTDPGFFAPRTAVLCPCRGMEPGLERNLSSLCEFTHQNFEVFFILASENDAAYSLVKRVAASSRVKAHIVIAGKPDTSSEKVNNLRVAIEQLPSDFEALVFVDSDGRPGKTWLHHIVAPLADSRIGATTTMRWFIPANNALPNALLAAWNASVVTMLGGHDKNFCWGGGTAIRRSLFDQMGMLDIWQHSFSDDYSLTIAIERTRRQIVFLPECLTPSYVQTDFESLLEFTNRQIKITRIYRPKMWATAFATHFLYCFTLLLGLFLALDLAIESRPSSQVLTLLVLPLLLAAFRGALRVIGVTDAIPSVRAEIMAQSWIYVAVTLLVPFLYLINFCASLIGRRIKWRGIQYEIISPDQTRVLTP
ncbi:MAG TPA: glycosyltransferase family 2 protein [Candidatus Limnocylindrales bacterium]|nr:glycosyltransferase family 2 protein [Candidatus Limnocylindrales bacterium]